METNFNFKSQVCTDKEQSERLLALGLKKETADCGHFYGRQEYEESEDWETVFLDNNWLSYWDVTDTEIPAWSLHRLIKLIYTSPYKDKQDGIYVNSVFPFNQLIARIRQLIEIGQFNKEYLV